MEKSFPAYQGDEPYVFVSYAHGDAAFFHRTLAASFAHEGRVDEAHAALARATDLEPDFTLGGGRRIMLAGNPQMADRYMSGLRMAGLK